MSHGQHSKEPAAPAEAEPAPAAEPLPAPASQPAPPPAPTLEERVAKLESYIPRIEAILGGP